MSEKIATREAYGKALVELGEQNKKVVVLDADLAGATMTKYFKAAHPDRFFDCGLAEANMMNIGAGLSTMGLVPFCSTFAMFGAGRAYEQIRNSIAYPKFNVKICCSHAGVSVGEDGGSHQAIEDIGLMRLIPGMTVIVPADAKEARKATFALADFQGPAYMRLARLATPVFEEDYPFEIGKANVLREGKDAAVFACGLMVNEALEAAKLLAAEGIEISVINVHTIKPIDAECVTKYAEKCGNVVTVEEHSVIGGLGDAVADVLMGKVCCKFRKIGVNDQFGQSGKAADVLREYGLTADQIAEKIKEALYSRYNLHLLLSAAARISSAPPLSLSKIIEIICKIPPSRASYRQRRCPQMEFEQVYDLYFRDVYRYILKLSGSEHVAEEITSDTFFKALRSIGKFRGSCDMRVWLCQIAKNCYSPVKSCPLPLTRTRSSAPVKPAFCGR